MKGKILVIVCAAAVAIAGIYYFARSEKITNFPPMTGTNIIAFGDSLVYGVGSTKGYNFVSLLEQRLGVTIENKGVSGNTTADGVARLHKDVIENDPKIVLVLLGGNDYLRRRPKEETFKNLQTIVDEIHRTGAVVLLLGIRGGLLKDNYREDFDDFAEKNHVAYVPNVLDGILGDKELMYDEVHPNDKGYKLIADKVEPVLRKLVRGVKSRGWR